MGWPLRGPALTKAAQRIAPSRQGALHCGHISKKGRGSAPRPHPNEAMLGPVLCHKIDLLTREESNLDVRYGSEADLKARTGHVRFAAHSGHAQRRYQCLLSAKSRHLAFLE